MATLTDLGKRIFGNDRGFTKQSVGSRSKASDVRHGTAQAEAADGWVSVLLDGSDEAVDLECDVPVAEGQRVSIAIDSGTYKVISVGQVAEIAQEAADAAAKAQSGIDNLEIGARNLLRNSRTLVYADYAFRGATIDLLDSTYAIIGTGVLGRMIVGKGAGKLDTPTIWLSGGKTLPAPSIGLYEYNGRLNTPDIELITEG